MDRSGRLLARRLDRAHRRHGYRRPAGGRRLGGRRRPGAVGTGGAGPVPRTVHGSTGRPARPPARHGHLRRGPRRGPRHPAVRQKHPDPVPRLAAARAVHPAVVLGQGGVGTQPGGPFVPAVGQLAVARRGLWHLPGLLGRLRRPGPGDAVVQRRSWASTPSGRRPGAVVRRRHLPGVGHDHLHAGPAAAGGRHLAEGRVDAGQGGPRPSGGLPLHPVQCRRPGGADRARLRAGGWRHGGAARAGVLHRRPARRLVGLRRAAHRVRARGGRRRSRA